MLKNSLKTHSACFKLVPLMPTTKVFHKSFSAREVKASYVIAFSQFVAQHSILFATGGLFL